MDYLTFFTSLEHMDACLIGGLKDWFNNLLAEKDLVVIAWLDAGSRSVYNSKNAINKMEDMNGLLLRVPENDVFMSSMAAFGATGTPMPMGDIYSALQTGVIDGAENAAPVLYSMKHYEVAKYFSLTEHIRTPDVLIMSKSYLGVTSKGNSGCCVGGWCLSGGSRTSELGGL